MNKRETTAFIRVAMFLNDEADRRAEAFKESHPYVREVRRAQRSLETLRNSINSREAKPAKAQP